MAYWLKEFAYAFLAACADNVYYIVVLLAILTFLWKVIKWCEKWSEKCSVESVNMTFVFYASKDADFVNGVLATQLEETFEPPIDVIKHTVYMAYAKLVENAENLTTDGKRRFVVVLTPDLLKEYNIKVVGVLPAEAGNQADEAEMNLSGAKNDTITPLGSFIEFFCEEATDVIVITDSRLSLADLHRDIPSTSREKLHVIPYDAFVTPEPMEDFEFIEWDELELLE